VVEPAAGEPEMEPESEVGTAAVEAAEAAFTLGLGVNLAKARFAHALRIDPDVEDALIRPERTVQRLAFLAKLASRAERRYREIAGDPQQQLISVDGFAAEVRQNAAAADGVIGSILGPDRSDLDDAENHAYADLDAELTGGDVGTALTALRSFGEPAETNTPRATGAQQTRKETGR
jgi:hypothetical protein